MNDIDIDVNVTAWKIGPVIIMRGTATPTTAETPRIPRTPVRAAETRRHQRQ